MEILTMGEKEMTQLEIMQKLKEKPMSQAEAGRQMRVGERQVRRLWRAYRTKRAAGLGSKRRGKKSNHQMSQAWPQVLPVLQEKWANRRLHQRLLDLQGMQPDQDEILSEQTLHTPID